MTERPRDKKYEEAVAAGCIVGVLIFGILGILFNFIKDLLQ